MKKGFVLIFLLIFTMVMSFGVAGIAADKTTAGKTYKAKLSGKEEVPPVKTKAKGTAEFTMSADATSLTYKLSVKNIENVSAAHIHQGKKGQAGPPVVSLMTEKKSGKVSGTLSEGTIADKDLIGPLQGKTLKALADLIHAGNAYVNVHTDKNPDGEIRGQIK